MGEIPDKVSADIVLTYLRGSYDSFRALLGEEPSFDELDSAIGGALVLLHTMADDLLAIDLDD